MNDIIFAQTVSNNLNGKALEKAGEVDKAIELYEWNVKHKCEGDHPYKRLAIIYHKRQMIDDEIRVLKSAIKVFEKIDKERPDRDAKLKWFNDRLKKVTNG